MRLACVLLLMLIMSGCLGDEGSSTLIRSEKGSGQYAEASPQAPAGNVSDSNASQWEMGGGALPPGEQPPASGTSPAPPSGTSAPPPQTGGPSAPAAPTDISEAVAQPEWESECGSSSDCGFGELCEYGTCVETECAFASECPSGKDFCFDGDCVSESELYSRYERCSPSSPCTGSCGSCKSGKRSCMAGGTSSGNITKSYYICVECSQDYSCDEGYRCVHFRCVMGPA